jgi:hypothetical protein
MALQSKIPLIKINQLLDQKCNSCNLKKQFNQKKTRLYASFDPYCNKKCETGKALQELGKLLIREGTVTMPNKYGWLSKEEVLATGLPYYSVKDDIGGWSSKAFSFAVLLSKTRCQKLKCPILSKGKEKPSAYRYARSPIGKYCYVPLYDRTEFYLSGNIERKSLEPHEIMEF